jgi:predicted permease
MTIFFRIRALVRWLFRREEIERALDTDLADYIGRAAAEKVRAGMSEAEARRAVRIELGGVEQTKDSVRATLSLSSIDNTLADLNYALRTLRRQKTFTAVTVLTLALGIGVNVAIFSLYEQILLRPLPVADPEQLVNLSDPGPRPRGMRLGSNAGGTVFSYPMFRDLERAQEPFVGIAAHRDFGTSLSTGEQSQPATGLYVSGSYFPLLGLQPALGRLLGPQDDAVDGQADSVVLSHAYWQSQFGGDSGALGRTLLVNGVPLTIVGVAPPRFHGTIVGTRAAVFVPITFRSFDTPFSIPNHDNRRYWWLPLFARLEPGIGREQAEVAINSLYRGILNEVEAPLLTDVEPNVLEQFRTMKSLVLESGAHGQSALFVSVRDRLEMLLAISAGVLLLCCANVAGLVLVRGSARTGEIAVRAAMGATRSRLASLLLAESLLLALPAALLGLPVALLTLYVLTHGVPDLPSAAFDVDLSVGAALVAITVAVASALAFGLAPVRGLTRTEPGKTLQAHGVRQTSGKGITLFRRSLATAQIALSMVLLAMTGVFAQSLANIARIDLGLDVESLVTFSMSPDTSGYSSEQAAQLFDRLEEDLSSIPGVSSAASSVVAVLGSQDLNGSAILDGADGPVVVRTHLNSISPNFFRTLGIPLLAGREFADVDRSNAAQVIVNERLAEQLGLGGDIIGRRIRGPTPGDAEIIGLVADAKDIDVRGEIEPQAFTRRAPGGAFNSANFYVRGARSPDDLLSAVRETVTRVAPIVPIANLRTMQQQVRENLATERYVAAASTAFAVLATALAGLGLYGVLAYSVAQRSREIGLRVALGAPTGRIRRMVLRQVAGMALSGIVLGAAAAALLGGAVQSLLFGVETADPLALAAAVAVLAAVTLGAAYIPARRASRVDPMAVLRYE